MAYLLTILILLPVAGTLALVGYSFVSSRREEHYRWIALIVTVATFVLSLLLLRGIGASGSELRFEENVSWIGYIGSRYHVAVDGISVWLVLLTTLLMPIGLPSSTTSKPSPSSVSRTTARQTSLSSTTKTLGRRPLGAPGRELMPWAFL